MTMVRLKGKQSGKAPGKRCPDLIDAKDTRIGHALPYTGQNEETNNFNRQIMRTYFFILAIALLSGACKKTGTETTAHLTTTSSTSIQTAEVADDPANADNPYDRIGVRHNQILAYAGLQDSGAADTAIAAIKAVILQYPGLKIQPVPKASLPIIMRVVHEDSAYGYVHVVADSPCSLVAKEYLAGIFRLVHEQAGQDYRLFKTNMMLLEEKAMLDGSLASADIAMVLKAASVARYSAWYWTFVPTPVGQYKIKDVIKWVATVSGDVAGAIAGVVKDGSIEGAAAAAAACSRHAAALVTYGMPG